jgi:hypothetical protein
LEKLFIENFDLDEISSLISLKFVNFYNNNSVIDKKKIYSIISLFDSPNFILLYKFLMIDFNSHFKENLFEKKKLDSFKNDDNYEIIEYFNNHSNEINEHNYPNAIIVDEETFDLLNNNENKFKF